MASDGTDGLRGRLVELYGDEIEDLTVLLDGEGPDSPGDLEQVHRLCRLAVLLQDGGRYDEAEPLLRRAIVLFSRRGTADPAALAAACHELAALLDARGEADEAVALYEQALALERELHGSAHPALVATLHNLALLKEAAGRLEEANALWAQARTALAATRRK